MKSLKSLFVVLCLVATSLVYAQIETPQPSPACSIAQKVALTDIEVSYSRPGMKDRKIFGSLVPYGEMWRLGANASTKLKTSSDITLGGTEVPTGEYALYAIPGEKEWTIILHNDLSLWGTGGYDIANDHARLKVVPRRTAETYETLTIDFSNLTTEGADMTISWENTQVRIPIMTKAIEEVKAQIKSTLIDGPGPGTHYQAARFYLDQDMDMDQALVWIDKAIEARPEAFWYVHQKAKILSKLDRKKEAVAAAHKSLQMAKENEDGDYGYIKNNETLLEELKKK